MNNIIAVICAATLAEGQTVISGVRCDLEIVDCVTLLNSMGAQISGAGTPEIRIEGVEKLCGCRHQLMPDRCECGLWMVAAAITRGDLLLRPCNPHHLSAEIDLLESIGARIQSETDALRISLSDRPKSIAESTAPYPGFPSHLQPPLMALLSLADGISMLTEGVYPNRFYHVSELVRMGAQIRRDGAAAIIHGIPKLSGTRVLASDTQACVALILAGLAAKGATRVERIYHADRHYPSLELMLRGLGAHIERIEGSS